MMKKFNLIPVPKSINEKKGITSLRNVSIVVKDSELEPIIPLFLHDLKSISGITMAIVTTENTIITLQIDERLRQEQYSIMIDKKVVVTGGSYFAVAGGTALLLQLLSDTGELPNCVIEDEPDISYRGLSLDIARQWHSISCIKKVIELCRFYRLSYLQLHLTDDESFTFPLECYPSIPTPERHYTKQELEELVEFANHRGVSIVPEIDLPGHAKALNTAEPDIFTSSRGEEHENAICLGNPAVYDAVNKIIGELCQVFKYSQYIHLGCDEAKMEIFENCPVCRKYRRDSNIPDVESLYRSYIIRASEMVKQNGRHSIIWEGFSPEKGIEIPKDITVMAWESYYNTPDNLSLSGYTLINCAWQPLYVTPDKGWSPEHIYNWNIRLWEHWWEKSKAHLSPIQLDESANVIGAQLCSWENKEVNEIELLHLRIPAMAERIWNVKRRIEWIEFASMMDMLDQKIMKIIN